MIEKHYKSDFKVFVSLPDRLAMVPFKFTYFIEGNRTRYVVSYDGYSYYNCSLLEDGRLLIVFQNHNLGIGTINVIRQYFLPDEDFASGVCRTFSEESTDIYLGEGYSDEGDIHVQLPPNYMQGKPGKSAYQEWLDLGNTGTVQDFLDSLRGESFTYEDFTEEQLKALKGDKGESIKYEDLTEDQIIEIATKLGLPSSEFNYGGIVNVTGTIDIDKVYSTLSDGGIALCIIGDSSGNYPSISLTGQAESRVNFNEKYRTSTNYFFSEEKKGANVGDLLMIAKKKLTLIERCVIKVIPLNDSKTATGEFAGTEGVMTVWDKERVNKVDGIERTANNNRDRLNSLNVHRYTWSVDMDDALENGFYAWVHLCRSGLPNGLNANYSLAVNRSTDADPNYYTIQQTAYGRTDGAVNRVWTRILFKHISDALRDNFSFPWVEITNTVAGGGDVDLSDYYTKVEVDAKIPTKTSELENDSNYATTDDIQQAIENAITKTLNTAV